MKPESIIYPSLQTEQQLQSFQILIPTLYPEHPVKSHTVLMYRSSNFHYLPMHNFKTLPWCSNPGSL